MKDAEGLNQVSDLGQEVLDRRCIKEIEGFVSIRYIGKKEDQTIPRFWLTLVRDGDAIYTHIPSTNIYHLLWVATAITQWRELTCSYACCGNNCSTAGPIHVSSQILWASSLLAATMSDLVKSLAIWQPKADQPHTKFFPTTSGLQGRDLLSEWLSKDTDHTPGKYGKVSPLWGKLWPVGN